MGRQLPASSEAEVQQNGGVFQAGHGGRVVIQGGHFVQHNQAHNAHWHNCSEADDGFKHLQAHVATTAFDSGEHVDAPKCHPNTRKAILDEIMTWILQTITRVQWILWLNGAAGAGKSAIARSIVELCVKQDIPIVRFFFFRTDSTRNNIKPLVATLVHQLLRCIPDLKSIIIPRIDSDSLIFTKSLETQFEYLIFEPLRELLHDSSFHRTLVLLFDGLDECTDHKDQVSIIRIISRFVGTYAYPVIAFFGSRTETQLNAEFRSLAVSKTLLTLPLDNHYLPDNDILLFLNDSFSEIKSTHHFNHLLPKIWPQRRDVEEIVTKSSGQFIYASVAMKFISTPSLHPGQQLEIVRGLRPPGNLTPFAQLDALYRYIFSQVADIDLVTRILASVILSNYKRIRAIKSCAAFFGLQDGDIHVALADLTSVISCEDGNIDFLHTSLPDFLFDKARSQNYHIDRATWSTRLSILLFRYIESKGFPSSPSHLSLDMYLHDAEGNPELAECIERFDPSRIDWSKAKPTGHGWSAYLTALKQLDFGNGVDGVTYRKHLSRVTLYLLGVSPGMLDELSEEHDISGIIDKVDPKKEKKRMPRKSLWVRIKSSLRLSRLFKR